MKEKARINRPGPDTKPSISFILSLRIKAARILDQTCAISSSNRRDAREKNFFSLSFAQMRTSELERNERVSDRWESARMNLLGD